MIGHLVDRFNANDTSTEFFALNMFLELVLGLAWAKYQYGFCITNAGNNLVKVIVEMAVISAMSVWFSGLIIVSISVVGGEMNG